MKTPFVLEVGQPDRTGFSADAPATYAVHIRCETQEDVTRLAAQYDGKGYTLGMVGGDSWDVWAEAAENGPYALHVHTTRRLWRTPPDTDTGEAVIAVVTDGGDWAEPPAGHRSTCSLCRGGGH